MDGRILFICILFGVAVVAIAIGPLLEIIYRRDK